MAKKQKRWCQWCTAREGEKFFAGVYNTCNSCARMRFRDKCHRCDGPRMKDRCSRCDPPPVQRSKKGDWVEIILLDASSDEERTIYRAPASYREGGIVSFRFLGQTRREEEPVVLTITRKQFLKTLC